jgi:enoyl-CoA hydratase
MSFDNLLLERDGAVAVVTLNRPRVLNALDTQTIDELRRAVLELKHDEAIRCLIVTGAGEKAFVSGADIEQLVKLSATEAKGYSANGQHVFDLVENMGKPVIAAINGYALGGGCELAMACTVRLAAEGAKLGLPEIKLGLIPGFGGTQRLPRLVGKGRALELILTGRMVDAQEALAIGLVHRLVSPASELMAEARSLAATIAAQAPVAMRLALEAVHRGTEMAFPEGESHEASLFGLAASTEDMRAGTSAFLEKRRATFTGR